MRNLRFPFNVVRLAPVKGKADEIGIAWLGQMAITARPAELRPVRLCSQREGYQNQR